MGNDGAAVSERDRLNRWRLILGEDAEQSFADTGAYDADSFPYADLDEVLAFLFERERGEQQGYRREGGRGASRLTVPVWLGKVRTLFPKQVAEVLEKQALETYQLTELLRDRALLERLEPNMSLLRSILQFKGLMKGEVLESAKAIVREVAEQLACKLEMEARQALGGRRNRYRRGLVRTLGNLNMKRTIAANLKHYDRERRRLLAERLHFDSRLERRNKWHVVLAVDESGSMLDSVIYSAVMAGIFHRLRSLRTHFIIFDTQVVDLSDRLEDPVELLMSVQLGGGTHIAKALHYGHSLLEQPTRTLFILVSDLEEGYAMSDMYRAAKQLLEAGCKLLVLTALNDAGHAVYNTEAARQLARMGAHVAAMTPEQLPQWMESVMS